MPDEQPRWWTALAGLFSSPLAMARLEGLQMNHPGLEMRSPRSLVEKPVPMVEATVADLPDRGSPEPLGVIEAEVLRAELSTYHRRKPSGPPGP